MRIIAGRNRGRSLKAPAKNDFSIRPTSDRARESLFNIIGPRITGARFLDLFAGTGAVGLEAESRGADETVLVEANPGANRLIAANIAICAAADRCRLIMCDLGHGLSPLVKAMPDAGFDLVFLDPPYESGFHEPILAGLSASGLMAPDCLVIAEERRGADLPEELSGLVISQIRRYGENAFWFYNRE